MPQHDQVIDNGTGSAVRADINAALAALFSNSEGPTEPPVKIAYQFWPDTTAGKLKIRNAANTAWITLGDLKAFFGFFSTSQNAAASGTITPDFNTARVYRLKLAGAVTIAAPLNSPASPDEGKLVFVIEADGTNEVTWNSVFDWGAGSPPVFASMAALQTAIVVAATYDGGANFFSMVPQTGFTF